MSIHIIIKSKPNMFTSLLGEENLLNRVNIIFGDITDYKLVETVVAEYEINYIIDLAAISIVRVCNEAPLVSFYNNVYSVAVLAEITRRYNHVKQLIVSTSDKAYGQSDKLPYEEDGTPLYGMRPYEATKTLGDLWCQMYQKNYNSPITVFRSANIYGPADPNMSRLIPQVCSRVALDKNPWLYRGVDKYIREFVYIDDVIDFIITLMQKGDENPKLIRECYNLGSGNIFEIDKLVETIITISGKNISIDIKDKELDFYEIPEQYLSLEKTANLLGWKAYYTGNNFVDSLVETYNYYYDLVK